MKLLFDENLSHRLVEQIASGFPGSVHFRDVGLQAAPDRDIWKYAAANAFLIVSKDTDFQQRALLFGHPPKVIWVRLGNCSTASVASLLYSALKTSRRLWPTRTHLSWPYPDGRPSTKRRSFVSHMT
jgi:predicted nuclease of predicted toxin-antitoxin system